MLVQAMHIVSASSLFEGQPRNTQVAGNAWQFYATTYLTFHRICTLYWSKKRNLLIKYYCI